MARTNDAIVAIRRNEIRELLLKGESTSMIAVFIREKYGITKKSVEHDITLIYKTFKKEYKNKIEKIIQNHLLRYEEIYRFYMNEGTEDDPNIHFDPEKASKMLEKIERLTGILNKQAEVIAAVQINNTQINYNKIIPELTKEELRELLNENE